MPNLCIVCGNKTHQQTTMTHVFTAPSGEKVLIDNIPVTECTQCGEQTLSFETTEHIMEIVQAASDHTLNAARDMPVYEYA
jgi:YgiT-type zinc finger domain-containing protein